MNIVQLEDDIKSLPDQTLIAEMQNPTGGFPQYLVMSEIKRRKQMRDDYQGRMAAYEKTPPRPTMAEETVAEGIGSIMPSNMPQGAPPQGMPMAQGMPVNRPASIEGGGLEDLLPKGGMLQGMPRGGMPQGMPRRMGMAQGGRTNRVMMGKTNYQDATYGLGGIPQGGGLFGLEGLDPSFFQQTEAEKAYQEMMLDYYSPERRKKRDRYSRGMNMLRAGLAAGTARTPEQFSASMGPVIEGAISRRAAGEKEDLTLAGAQSTMAQAERDRQLKLAQLGIQAKQAKAYGQYMTKPSAWSERENVVRNLAGSGPPVVSKPGVALSSNKFVQYTMVKETKDGKPVLDRKGKPIFKATNPLLTNEGAEKIGILAQQGTYASAEMRYESNLQKQASANVQASRGIMDTINKDENILKRAKFMFKSVLNGAEPSEEQLQIAADDLLDREIIKEMQRLRKAPQYQSGGTVLSTPTPVGFPSVQQMLE